MNHPEVNAATAMTAFKQASSRRDDVKYLTMNNNTYSTCTANQRQRLLNWLYTATLTTLQARQELDVMHPAARIQELKAKGHNIVTHWTTDNTGKAKHRVACYVLLTRGDHVEA